MNSFLGLFFPFVSGLFFLVGFVIVKFIKNRQALAIFSTSLAFVVMIGMLAFDLIPEVLELSELLSLKSMGQVISIILTIGAGIGLLKGLDILLPHHHHEHHDYEKEKKEHNQHLFHIGFIMTTSLILHNILEGMSMYVLSHENLSVGLLMALGVGLHNLPLGIEIASGLDVSEGNKNTTILSMVLLSTSALIGAFIMSFLGEFITPTIEFILVGVASGMIIYIAIFELLKEMYQYLHKKELWSGISVGIIFLLLMTFVG